MQGTLALVLSLMLSAFLIYRERRRYPDAEWTVWLPTLWFMLAVSKSVSYWLSPGYTPQVGTVGDFNTEGSPVDRSILMALMVVSLVVLYRRRIDWNALVRDNLAFGAFFLLMLSSVLWSDFPAVAVKRWFRASGDLILALVIVTDRKPAEAMKLMIRRAAIILVPLSIVLIKYFRYLGVAYAADGRLMWTGVASQKNSLGIFVAVVVVFSAIELHRMRRRRTPLIERTTYILLLGMSAYLLMGSGYSRSATALGAVLFAFMFFFWSNLFVKRTGKTKPVNLLLIVLVLVFLASSTVLELLVEASGRNMTFTGRTVIWDEILRVGAQQPILGFGYGTFWVGEQGRVLWSILRVTQGHNGYIETYLQLGIVGLVFLVSVIGRAYRNILKKIRHDYYSGILCLCFLMMVIVQNFMESTIAVPSSMVWFLFLVIGIFHPVYFRTEGLYGHAAKNMERV